MTRATAVLRTAAERLLKHGGAAHAPIRQAAADCSERLRQVLSPLMGAAGFRALQARALTLARAETSGLSALQVAPDGSLQGLPTVERHDDRASFTEGEIVLVAHLIGLLVTFIGEALMLRLVSDAWPQVTLDDLDFDKGMNRE